MAFEDIKAEMALLLAETGKRPENRHDLYLQVMQRLNEVKGFGMPVPDDLLALETALESKFAEEMRESMPPGS